MTIYDLTQALKRYKRFIFIAFGLLVLLTLIVTFTIEDGKPTFRSAEKYESSIQIGVVAPGTDSLISSSGGGNFAGAASLYASLLSSDEASKWIGDQNGYRLEDPVDATTDSGSVITARVIGPTPEQAKGAALSTFDWLSQKLKEPVTTADFPTPSTTVPLIYLEGDFASRVNISLDENMGTMPSDVFLFAQVNQDNPIPLPLPSAAGDTLRARATLNPLTTVTISVSTVDDEVLDTIRITPEPAPTPTETVPELNITLTSAILQPTGAEGDESPWRLSDRGITTFWTLSAPAAPPAADETVDVDLALLTDAPGFTSTGGRRGPITAVAMFIIGAVLIMTIVIVTDTWRRERDERESIDRIVHENAPDEALTSDVSHGGASPKGRNADIEVRTSSLDP